MNKNSKQKINIYSINNKIKKAKKEKMLEQKLVNKTHKK